MHAGHILIGSIGAVDHYEYRPVGDIVNTASRMESLNKHLGTQVLVSDQGLHLLDGFERTLSTYRADGPSIIYKKRCEAFKQNPPDETWDGTVIMGQK